jgi:hypothetical protein
MHASFGLFPPRNNKKLQLFSEHFFSCILVALLKIHIFDIYVKFWVFLVAIKALLVGKYVSPFIVNATKVVTKSIGQTICLLILLFLKGIQQISRGYFCSVNTAHCPVSSVHSPNDLKFYYLSVMNYGYSSLSFFVTDI